MIGIVRRVPAIKFATHQKYCIYIALRVQSVALLLLLNIHRLPARLAHSSTKLHQTSWRFRRSRKHLTRQTTKICVNTKYKHRVRLPPCSGKRKEKASTATQRNKRKGETQTNLNSRAPRWVCDHVIPYPIGSRASVAIA